MNLRRFFTRQNVAILGFVTLIVLLVVVNLFIPTGSRIGPAASPEVINKQGDTILFENDDFQITWLAQTDSYIISVNNSPFETYRQQAEQKFIEILSRPTQALCRLTVSVVTPYFANPDESGIEYFLSFCQKPEPSINPALVQLSVKNVFPAEGTLEAGGTTAGIALTFDRTVSPETAIVSSSPNLTFKTYVHPNRQKELYIEPTSNWEVGKTYQITIHKGLLSQDATAQLKDDVTLTYVVTEHVPADFEETP